MIPGVSCPASPGSPRDGRRRGPGILMMALVLLIVPAGSAVTQQPAQPQAPLVLPVALFPFEEREPGTKGYGAKVTDLLFAKLVARPELYLVDRDDLKKTLQEQELGLSGLMRPDSAARVGQLSGAKVLVGGSIVLADKKMHLVARIVGTETSRMFGASVECRVSDELGPTIDRLAGAVADTIAKQGDKLVAPRTSATDRIAELNKQLKDSKRPRVMITIPEHHVGRIVHDPAAQTELMRFCKATGVTVLDPGGPVGQADILIVGEGVSEVAGRVGNLVSVKARVELKAVERTTDKVLVADRQTVVVVDLAEQIAGKTALQQAGAILAERLLPRLVQK